MGFIKWFANFSREHVIIASLLWLVVVHILNCIIRGKCNKKTWKQIQDDILLKSLIEKIRED